jgi:hypothetical protein
MNKSQFLVQCASNLFYVFFARTFSCKVGFDGNLLIPGGLQMFEFENVIT